MHIKNALGDETRLRLVARLSGSEPLSMKQLGAGTHLTRQGLTKHLRVLADVHLVQPRKEGREQLWSVNSAQIEQARRTLEGIGRAWEKRLPELKLPVENES